MSVFRTAHISDLHCGSPHFVPSLMERAIVEINDLESDVVVCSSDLTEFGFKVDAVLDLLGAEVEPARTAV